MKSGTNQIRKRMGRGLLKIKRVESYWTINMLVVVLDFPIDQGIPKGLGNERNQFLRVELSTLFS